MFVFHKSYLVGFLNSNCEQRESSTWKHARPENPGLGLVPVPVLVLVPVPMLVLVLVPVLVPMPVLHLDKYFLRIVRDVFDLGQTCAKIKDL